MEKYKNIELNEISPEFDEILGVIPSWITRWGISVIIGILALVVTLSNIVSFSDSLSTRFEIYSDEIPFRLTWYKDELDIDYYLVAESGTNVQKGDTLLIKTNNVSNINKYILSPLSGKLNIVRGEEKNYIAQTLIVTPPISDIEVQVIIPKSKYSELEKGQIAKLSINEFPSEKYGFLIGKIDKVLTEYLEVDSYRAYVILEKGLITDKDFSVPLKSHYTGDAEVVLRSRTILSRVLSPS